MSDNPLPSAVIELTLVIPAANDHIRFARLMASAVAARLGYDYDTIENLRIAVSELCTTVTEDAASGDLTLTYRGDTDGVRVSGHAPRGLGIAGPRRAGRVDAPDPRCCRGRAHDRVGTHRCILHAACAGHCITGDVKKPESSESELFATYRSDGNEALRNRLVERYSGLAVSLARRFDHRGVPLEDLVQIAQIGLIKAVERYDPDRGAAFTTYAAPTVLGEIKRHFRDKTWTVKVPRGVKDLHIRVTPAVAELHHMLGRSPTIAEIANHLGSSEDDLLEAIEAGAAYRPDSMDTTRQDGDGPSPGDRFASLTNDQDLVDTRVTVRTLMAQLPERERTIVYLRYFEDLTQAEIADRVGVSQVHISRLLRSALERLGGPS